MSNVKNFIICMLSAVILVLGGYIVQMYLAQPTLVALWKPCVPDEETAIEIAQVMFKVYTGYELDKDDFAVVSGDTQWQVHLKNEADFGEPGIVDDDSGVTINKQDGTIISVHDSAGSVECYFKLKAKYE